MYLPFQTKQEKNKTSAHVNKLKFSDETFFILNLNTPYGSVWIDGFRKLSILQYK